MEFTSLARSEFVALKQQFVHPSTEISQPDQLIGREKSLQLVRNAFERAGSNIFIWGKRGVGKTSLAHSAITKYSDTVCLGPAIACERTSTVNQLFTDIARRALSKNKSLFSDRGVKLKFAALGFSIEGEFGSPRGEVQVASVNQASELLSQLFPRNFSGAPVTAILIDEFDSLENQATIDFLTALAKQMSVDGSDVKFIFCGVANDLEALIGSHESVGRYISAIELSPLSDNEIWEIVDGICSNFEIEMPRSQKIRIGQIACGYPTFAHLIMDELLNVVYEAQSQSPSVAQEYFNEAMRRAAASAATHLRGAYEAATLKGTDRYVEVLWAVANGPHISGRQFKDINGDYHVLMKSRPGRNELQKEQDVRNHVNALCRDTNASVLEKLKTGWYRFKDPMFRGYVRMIAFNEGVELGDESFPR